MKNLTECVKEEHKLSDIHHALICHAFAAISKATSTETAAYICICQAIFQLHEAGEKASAVRDFLVDCVNLNLADNEGRWKGRQ